uniref:Ubiquitin fusion degradation protein 1 homolog n=1 Tax=Nelumbo nucifera TaxID=4432 RepID=A0A822YFC4_NELNU|nr:TPA_asm: hypothetical protein HUJ06_029696 [Nelumbo nucifera]
MAYEYYDYHGLSFKQSYRCYPVSFIEKSHLENGDKIIMPPSALDRLASLQINYPMLFELWSGLLAILDDGEHALTRGDLVQLKNVTLPKGTYVKLQPHTKDFIEVSNPKAILEKTLRNYSCLTTGDKKFYIDIVETKPSAAISIIETDCEVDFVPPLDYKEPEHSGPSSRSSKLSEQVQEESSREETKFIPFTGLARRLDGKPLAPSPGLLSSPVLKVHQANAANGTNGSKSPSNSSRQGSGKLVFGSNANLPLKETPKPWEEQKFQAFTGKKYSLKA